MVLNLVANVSQSIDFGETYGYVTVFQANGDEPVYMDSKTVAVAQTGAIVIQPNAKPKAYRYDNIQVLHFISAADTQVVVEPEKKWPGTIRRTLTPSTVEVFDFPAECRTFEISNLDDSTEAFFALDRDPDSAEEWTRKVKPNSGYYPSEETECYSIRVISTAAVEIEVTGYAKEDPLKRDHNTRR